jgi:integrase/recombinase XerD
MRSVNTSESYQNRNIKALINMAKFFGKDFDLIHLSKKEDILSFLDFKIKSKEDDPDGKWMRNWNDYPQRIKYFFRWLHNEKLRQERNEESLEPSDWVTPTLFLGILQVYHIFLFIDLIIQLWLKYIIIKEYVMH